MEHIYCYGGTSDQKPTSDHYMLDVSQDFSLSSAVNSWQTVPSGDYVLEPNSLFTMVPFNSSYLIHGGLGYGSTQQYRKNLTVLFDATTQAWKTVSDNETVSSREATGTLDSLGRIWYWGGLRTTYHHDFSVLNTQNFSWAFPNNNTPSFVRPRVEHTATLTHSGNSIYFIGGLEINEDGTIVPAPMNEILEYNVINSTWTLLNTKNSTVPSSRRLHSATAVPNTDLILIYGGSSTDSPKVVSDYIYLLNTTSLTWSTISLANPDQGANARFGHSAVLYKQHTLFIIFGVDILGLARNDFFLLDLEHWQWVTEFKTSDAYTASMTTTTTSSSSPSSNTGLSSEASATSQQSSGTRLHCSIYLNCLLFFLLLF
ncbi:hypothetical protein G6F55_007747 [Rhizopus delemar]|uniref:Attractin/MKLN-like beta-propeller domain-containing protein n=1 Tax=Rhizopus delemar TaxID=936053 RepID=A0A9P6YWL5_9FUNG|nr:hypothetical protein G6F55_007747 [Rhizopus delemar]KAG1514177.1 hypothetical protein G6F53_003871 [Rhizopus delemar]KAG1522109.1 hypothetical protein G6F52_006150 [Rhizopus delemar]KAG1565926.1 hypothetical protein G6F50_009616 [Rhizopus delemar]KAG1618146.1 hypothetical protein G6F45_011984 [Rhizopus arrhizus]